jgi:hypothetical protein
VQRRLVAQAPVGLVGRTVVEQRQVGEVDVVAADARRLRPTENLLQVRPVS